MYNLILKQNTRDKLRMPEMFLFKYRKRMIFRFLLTQLLWRLREAYVILRAWIEWAFDVETFLKMVFIKPFCLFPGLSTKRLKRS